MEIHEQLTVQDAHGCGAEPMGLLDYDPKQFLRTRLGDRVGEIAQVLFAAGGGHSADDAPREQLGPMRFAAVLGAVTLVVCDIAGRRRRG